MPFSFVVEFANGFNLGLGVWGKTVAPKIPRVICLSHPCIFSVFCGEVRQIRPAELGKQPECFRALDELSG